MMAAAGRRLVLLSVLALAPRLVLWAQSRDSSAVATARTGQIAGTITAVDAAPVRRATMTLTAERDGSHLLAVSDDAGRFVFANLPIGRYSLAAAKGGWLPATYGSTRPSGTGTPIDIGDGAHVAITMTLVKGGVITGTVRDENGRPIPDATVAPYRYVISNQTGERTLQQVSFEQTATTDDRGVYRVYGLAPGDYLVSATSPLHVHSNNPRIQQDVHQTTAIDLARAVALLQQPRGASVTNNTAVAIPAPDISRVDYAPVFYAAALTSAEAAAVTVGRAEERGGIDISLRPVPTARVEGVATGPDGAPVAGASIFMIDPGPQPPEVLVSAFRNATSDAGGRFVLPGIPPGRYTVVGQARAAGLTGTIDVAVDGHDITAPLQLSPGVTVSGRIVFDGTAAAPAMSAVHLVLLPIPMSIGLAGAEVAPDGAFVFRNVAPGPYRLRLNGAPPTGWILASSAIGGVDVSDVPLEVRPGENVVGGTVTLSNRPASITGTLLDAAGQPAPAYVLIVFAADKQFWVPQTRRTQLVRPGVDGHFIARNLPPGSYLIGAVTNVEDGAWNDPAFLAELASHAPIAITLDAGESKAQDIRVGTSP